LNITRIGLYTDIDRPLVEAELATCRERLARRGKREPLAYIHGSVEFADCTLTVNPNVLIPRQETELLVEKIAKQIAAEGIEDAILWDMCCGSGCIGIALKKRCPKLNVVMSDVSAEAVKVAQGNVQANQVDVQVLQGDLFAPFTGQRCHYFVCNPPYVSAVEYAKLEPEVHDFEPKLALVAERDGYAVYERLAQELPTFLLPGGKAWFEIGQGMGSKLLELFSAKGWKQRRVENDWAGHERFFFLENE
jgi:release factor glutamine methyltransferase